MHRRIKALLLVIVLLAFAVVIWRIYAQDWRLVGEYPVTSNYIRHLGPDGVWYGGYIIIPNSVPLYFRDWQGQERWQITIPNSCVSTVFSPNGHIIAILSLVGKDYYITTWKDGRRIGHVRIPTVATLQVQNNGQVWILTSTKSTLYVAVVEGNHIIASGNYTSSLPRFLSVKEQKRIFPDGNILFFRFWELTADASTATFHFRYNPESLSKVFINPVSTQSETISLIIQGARVIAKHMSYTQENAYPPSTTLPKPGTTPIWLPSGRFWTVPSTNHRPNAPQPAVTPSGRFALVREDRSQPQHILNICSYLEYIPGAERYTARIKQSFISLSLYEQPGRIITQLKIPVDKNGKKQLGNHAYDIIDNSYISPDGRRMIVVTAERDMANRDDKYYMLLYSR